MTATTTNGVSPTQAQADKWGKNRGYRCHEKLYRAYEDSQRKRGRTITDGIIEHMSRVTGIPNEPSQ